MKNKIISTIIASAFGLFAPQIVQAQGTLTYLSNLGQPSTGSEAIGSDSWLAELLFTGSNAGGYVFNSVQLGMTDASGNPSGFTVMLYGAANNPAAVLPGSSLGSLSGSLNPAIGGIFTYTPASNLTLSPSTYYFIVLTAGTAVANGAYEWNLASTGSYGSYNPSGGWFGGGPVIYSRAGSSWAPISGIYPQFAVSATAVPEPGVLGLFGLGGLGLLWHRRRLL